MRVQRSRPDFLLPLGAGAQRWAGTMNAEERAYCNTMDAIYGESARWPPPTGTRPGAPWVFQDPVVPRPDARRTDRVEPAPVMTRLDPRPIWLEPGAAGTFGGDMRAPGWSPFRDRGAAMGSLKLSEAERDALAAAARPYPYQGGSFGSPYVNAGWRPTLERSIAQGLEVPELDELKRSISAARRSSRRAATVAIVAAALALGLALASLVRVLA